MASAPLREVSRWSDLQAAGGECLGPCWPWSSLETTERIDGDDRLTGTLGAAAPGALDLLEGEVLRLTFEDDSVAEWIVADVHRVVEQELVQVNALPARVWLEDRVRLRSGGDFELSGSGTLEAVLDAMIATDEWPAWAIRGTVNRNPVISYSWVRSTGLAGVLAAANDATATDLLTLEGETVRFAFRRVDDTEWAVDMLTGPVAGTPALLEGRNLTGLTIRRERALRASAIYPYNAAGASIAEAMFAVRTAASNILDMRDWAYRPDFQGVAFDGQWVGWYAVAPDGTTSLIVDSWVATQQIEVLDDSAWGAGNNATVRISPTSGGAATVALVDTTVATPRGQWLPGTWSSKINWFPNSWFEEWVSATQVRDYAVSGGVTVNRLSGASDHETGSYGLEYVSGATVGELTVLEVLMPDEVVSNNGGTQTWRVGIRAKKTATTGDSAVLEYSLDGGSTWLTAWTGGGFAMTSNATFTTTERTFTTTAAILPNRPRIRIKTASGVAGTKWVIDRLWMFRDGVDTGDNTHLGNGPSVGFYAGQRELMRQRLRGVAYDVRLMDRNRAAPSGFPNEALAVGRDARLMYPSEGLDLEIPIVQLTRDLLHPLATTGVLGGLRRRLIDTLRA